MAIDIDAVRRDTPGVRHRVHLNSAGAGLMPTPVVDTMVGYLRREAEIGGYEAAGERSAGLDGVYGSVARLVGAGRDEVALVENATVAWQMAFYALRFCPGDRILTSEAEYGANYVAFLQVARRTGAVIEVIPSDGNGELDPDALERMVDGRVKLVAITWIPTNGGLVNPAQRVGAVTGRHGIPYLLDACQAVGQMPVDVGVIGCDMLSATGRKFLRGPRGTGFLYIRRDLLRRLEPPMIDHFAANWVAPDRYELRADARRFENWENNYAARLGLGVAADYAMALGLDAIQERSWRLAGLLRSGLEALPGARVHDLGRRPSAIVSFSLDGRDPEAVKGHLAGRGINVTVSRPSSTLLDATARRLPALLRASPHYYNTEDEIMTLVEALREMPADPDPGLPGCWAG